jgi:UDP-glucose 4-epimerase
MVKRDMPSDVYNLSHRQLATGELVESLRELYPELETIFVDQHIPLQDLTMPATSARKGCCPATGR